MKDFIIKYKINPIGVVHIGAHFGGEITTYNELGTKNIVFVEPLSSTFQKLVENVNKLNTDSECNIIFLNKALGNKIGFEEMYVETVNLGQSSSLLKPEFHLQQYPGITFPYRETVEVSTLNSELKNIKGEFNILNIDVQGYELEVLKGSTDILDKIDIINAEVNRVHMYENCPLINEIDEFLSQFDFVKVDENWMGHYWGDAIYVKRKFIN
jgi:FkbM family methyltransferase